LCCTLEAAFLTLSGMATLLLLLLLLLVCLQEPPGVQQG
jgi:hypothetical protein